MRFDHRAELWKVAPRRLADARELLQLPTWQEHGSDKEFRNLSAACYLAGYAVECILKVYLIQIYDTARADRIETWSQVVEILRQQDPPVDLGGALGHNLIRLMEFAKLSGDVCLHDAAGSGWQACKQWDYNVRYDPAHMRPGGRDPHAAKTRTEAEAFVTGCASVYDWVKQRVR